MFFIDKLHRSNCAITGSFIRELGFSQLSQGAHPAQWGGQGTVLNLPTPVFDSIAGPIVEIIWVVS
jgi:hypothetical protein